MVNLYKVRKNARINLKKNFLPIIITMFLVGFIPFIAGVISSYITAPINAEIDKLLEIYIQPNISNYYRQMILSQMMSAYFACTLWEMLFSLVNLFTFCFELSLIAMFFITARGEKYEIKDFNDAFTKIKQSFCLNLLKAVEIFLWSLLFIIPGIIKAISYALANYIRLEEPELSANECLKKSEEKMKGRKGEFFALCCSFLGWLALYGFISTVIYIACSPLITISGFWGIFVAIVVEILLFILLLPLNAYFGVAEAQYYLEIVREDEERKANNYTYDNTAYRNYWQEHGGNGILNFFSNGTEQEPFTEFTDENDQNTPSSEF